MKIINIIKAILLLSVVITLPSCLDLDPKAQLADANLWQTPNDYKLYANQFYEWPRDFAAALFDGPHSDTRSDLITLVTTMNIVKESIRFLYRMVIIQEPILKSVMLISYYRMRRIMPI